MLHTAYQFLLYSKVNQSYIYDWYILYIYIYIIYMCISSFLYFLPIYVTPEYWVPWTIQKILNSYVFYVAVVQSLKLCLTLCNPMDCSTPGSFVFLCLPKFAQIISIESATLYNHLNLCFPLLLLPSIFPSIRVFSNESALCIRWPKYWSFSNSPSSEYSQLDFL